MWPFANMAPPPALESPQASRPTSVQMEPPLDLPPSVPRSAGLLMNLPSSSFTVEDDAPPMPLSTSPTRPMPRPPMPAQEQPSAPRREMSQRRMSIRRELPPLPGLQDMSATSSALLSPPRVRPDEQTLADQRNGLLSPPRSRKETGVALGNARASNSGSATSPAPAPAPAPAPDPAPMRMSRGSQSRPMPAPPQLAPLAPVRTSSGHRVSVARALPPPPAFATPAVATSNMIPNLPLGAMLPTAVRVSRDEAQPPRPPEKSVLPVVSAPVPPPSTALVVHTPAASADVKWVYSPEETALMKTVAQSAEARVRQFVVRMRNV